MTASPQPIDDQTPPFHKAADVSASAKQQDKQNQASGQSSPIEDPNRRTKILFFYQDFGAAGGIERFIAQLAKDLFDAKSYDPIVVCTHDSPLYHRLKEHRINVHGIESSGWLSNPHLRFLDLATWRQVKQILDREKPDLVHVHIGHLEHLFFKRWGYPVVYSFHGYGSLYSMANVMNPVKRWIKQLTRKCFRWMAGKLDALVFVSHAEQRRMISEEYLDPDMQAEVVHNGIDLTLIEEKVGKTDIITMRRTLGLPVKAPLVSFINRLDANKNPWHFLELVDRLCAIPELEAVHFVIAGNGPLEDEVRVRTRLKPYRDRIHVVGYQKDIYPLIATSSLIVHIPDREGFGLGVLEAMALGVPCIATKVGGIPEIVDIPEQSELLVYPGDIDGMVQRAVQWLNPENTQRDELIQSLKTRAQEFDLSRQTASILEVYHRVLNI
ncbi:MAG: glycosyltransferase family 4 protein [Vampirovibrio sp.]|nr:glycosyltransferase family 4 protein [Vampirovibrio sp.]